MKKISFVITILISMGFADISVGKIPSKVNISKANGGYVDGKGWSSSMFRGKKFVVLYIDPDEQSKNRDFITKLDNYKKSNKFTQVNIINLKASWIPNMAIETKMKSRQKDYPNDIYILDKNKILVKKWGLSDNNFDILLFGKDGRLLYKHYGRLDKSDIKKIFGLLGL